MKNKTNSVFDVVKIILALMVVLIHGKVLYNWIYPWVRIAVPFFFLMSSYFLFNKLNGESDPIKRKKIIKNFLLRNLKLYLVWFIILLPITIDMRNYFDGGNILLGVLLIIKDFFVSSTFAASWYIMALIEGVLIIYFCSKKLSNNILFIISFIINVFIIISCTYTFLVPGIDYYSFYDYINAYPFNSFLVGLVWIVIGKILAENKHIMEKYNLKKYILFIIASGLLLFVEYWFVRYKTNNAYRDCFFMLIPFTIALFNIIVHIKPFYFEKSLLVRKTSAIIYVTHKSLIFVFMHYFLISNRYIAIILSVITGVILTIIIDKLSNYIKFLKNAY